MAQSLILELINIRLELLQQTPEELQNIYLNEKF